MQPGGRAVADRWHLPKNLGEAVRKQLDREYSVLKQVIDEVILENKLHTECNKGTKCQIVKSIVNKIKTMKRQMYARTGFDLLKSRLLLNSE